MIWIICRFCKSAIEEPIAGNLLDGFCGGVRVQASELSDLVISIEFLISACVEIQSGCIVGKICYR